MKEENIVEIKKRAEKILRENSIITLSGEKEILKMVQEITNSDGDNIELKAKTLDDIERYLYIKEKMNLAEKDIAFLNELSKSLKEQEVRENDFGTPPLFILKNTASGKDEFFLTRKALKKYMTIRKKDEKRIVEVSSNDSLEIARLIEVIKRNF